MKIIKSPKKMISVMKEKREKRGVVIGLIPTLGCLHAGHEALIKRAKKECDLLVVSIFVNPLQFTKKAYEYYPRTQKEDRALLVGLGVDYLFAPEAKEMYPSGFDTSVEIKELTGRLDGAKIRWHYRGVTTVVTKLFNIVSPDRAYFGKKDPHQLAIIRRLVDDLHLAPKIIAVPTIRGKDGLALSSRNTLLSPEERKRALVISMALKKIAQRIKKGDSGRADLATDLAVTIEKEPSVTVDYTAVVDSVSLAQDDYDSGSTLIYATAFVGKWRLTDNMVVKNGRS